MRKKQVAMVVDDNQMFGDLVSKMLMRQGCDTFVCNDYESAIDMLNRSNIAFFMVDIFMPGMGGIEGIKKIRDMSPATTIIAMSGGWGGMSAKNSVTAAQKIGADACLEKPFTVKDVESTLQTLVNA